MNFAFLSLRVRLAMTDTKRIKNPMLTKRQKELVDYLDAYILKAGYAPTLEEIWTVFNPHDQHGVTNDMTKDQLNDLIEYLKTL